MNDSQFRKRRNGRIMIVITAMLTFAAIGYFYSLTMAPRWIRDFGLDIAARATIVSTVSDETAFSTMRGRPEPESPYICLKASAPFPWDRVYIIPSGGENLSALGGMDWEESSFEELQDQMMQDDRYQLIAFVQNDRVIDHEYYFTIWADLKALARTDGFSREDAVFLADSDGEIYTLTVAHDAPQSACSN